MQLPLFRAGSYTRNLKKKPVNGKIKRKICERVSIVEPNNKKT